MSPPKPAANAWPRRLNGRESLDYDLGVINAASFRSIGTSGKKQIGVRARARLPRKA